MDNVPTLTQSEEQRAPWNEKTKLIEVTISETLSSQVTLEVPEDFDIEDEKALEDIAIHQIVLPSDLMKKSNYNWCVDDFCVAK